MEAPRLLQMHGAGCTSRCRIQYGTDISVDPDGYVYPRTGGLSVAPGDPRYLPDVRRPRELGGRGKTRSGVWMWRA
jgi:hypothetical protein